LNILTRISETEEKLVRLFSEPVFFSKNLIRYKDEDLSDMYDLNYFHYSSPSSVTCEEIEKAIRYQKERGDGFFKLQGKSQLDDDTLKPFSLDKYCDITMLLKNGQPDLWTQNKNIEILNLRENRKHR